MEKKNREKIILALDTSKEGRVQELTAALGDRIECFKVGLEQYLASGGKVMEFLSREGKRVFLDLKFHDIPNTMAAAARCAVRSGAWMFNIHVSGKEAMKWVMEAVNDEAAKMGIDKPLVIGVTVLTSLADSDLKELGIKLPLKEVVINRARMAAETGLDGVVCSPREAGIIKSECGRDFLTVCPGIRPSWAVKGDQKRVMTPSEALQDGADYLVIGRPVTAADNPLEAAERILNEIE